MEGVPKGKVEMLEGEWERRVGVVGEVVIEVKGEPNSLDQLLQPKLLAKKFFLLKILLC